MTTTPERDAEPIREEGLATEWPEVEWDACYPVDEDFADIAAQPLNFGEAARFVLRELQAAAANTCGSCRVLDNPERDHIAVEFSTGGWSGNESLLALIERRFDTARTVFSWQRGGHYVFHISRSTLALHTATVNP